MKCVIGFLRVEALLAVTRSIEVFKDGSSAHTDVPLMVSKDTKWERLSSMLRSVETCTHMTADGCLLCDKVTKVVDEGEKLIKAAEAHLCEHYKMGVTSALKDLQPIAEGMADGSKWTGKIIEQHWDGICDTARKTLMKSDVKLRKHRKETLQQVCGSHLVSEQRETVVFEGLWAKHLVFCGVP